MIFSVKLPDIGEGVAEGEIVRWLVKPGEMVREDQPLVEVMTDKANVEIPSPRSGTIDALHAEEGQVVPVGTVIVTIAVAEGAKPPAPGLATAPGGTATEPKAAAQRDSIRGPAAAGTVAAAAATASPAAVQATPAVRQLARELGVSLERLAGSGPQGRITAEDVRAAAAAPAAKASQAASAVGAPRMPESTADAAREERVPLRGLRRKIAENMRRSLDTAAHFTFVAECDLSAVVAHRERALMRARQAGVSLTYLAYLVKALIEPLRQYPTLNASLDDQASEIILKRYYHVGIATATDEGLMVPVIQDADRRGLLEIASEIQRLARAARTGKLKLEELQGGTFTLTSTGARGGLLATPILHHPQVAILGVHEVKKRPVVIDDQIVAREMTHLSLSLDHRVVDGAVGADFLYAVIARLQQPEAWLTEEALR
ncbi:MAG TPA: dihydrolipoamide acetyltransferase family protein [Candidatus Eisenbacteria bacterium]|jgi:pyruvate dehydrogenase E2 component (dihydrolipoamide acetyltransferase)